MRIAINTLGPSRIKAGIGNYVINLVKGLQRLDKKNEYLLFVGKENINLFEQIKNFRLYNVGIFNKHKLLRLFWEQCLLPFILLKKQINLLHSPGFVSPVLKTTKQIVTIHDMTFFTHPQYHLTSKVRYFQNIIPISVKKADVIIADSKSAKQDITKLLKTNPDKIKTIYLGTNFKKQKNAKKRIQQKYGINAPFILFVGMLEPRKNIPNLIKAFAELAPKIKYNLVIVGKKGWMFEEIFGLVAKLNLKERVIFTGYIPDKDLEWFYSAAECFVYPSYYEGFGIPVIEAMACGCPVIATNNSSLNEIANNASILINNPGDIKEIAVKIKKVLFNKVLQKKLIQKGLVRAKYFNWRKTAEKTLEVYKKILQNEAYID